MSIKKNNDKKYFKKYPLYLLIIQTWIFSLSVFLSNYKILKHADAFCFGFFVSVVIPEIYYLIKNIKEKREIQKTAKLSTINFVTKNICFNKYLIIVL